MPIWCLGWVLVLFAFTAPLSQARELAIDDRLEEASARIAAELAAAPALELPPLPRELAAEPPEEIQRAGEEFAQAWRIYRVITLHRPAPLISLVGPPFRKVVDSEAGAEEFDRLLVRTIESPAPPAPHEFGVFTYKGDGWCATPIIDFTRTCDSARTLVHLRRGEHFEALQILARSGYSPTLGDMLRAYRVDPDEFIAGAWLNRKLTQHDFPPTSGDKLANMLVKWVELRWQAAGKDSVTSSRMNRDEPYHPLEGLVGLLRQEQGPTDETKARIGRFLNERGCEIHPPDYWVEHADERSAKWLEPVLRRALTSPYNRPKIQASKLLTAAGIEHPAPALTAEPSFRITVNGRAWPGILYDGKDRDAPDIRVKEANRERVASLTKKADGLYSSAADPFIGIPADAEVLIRHDPGRGSRTYPLTPWLNAGIALPIRFGAITEVDLKVVEVSIEPRIPASRKQPERLIEIDFARVIPGQPAEGATYHLENSGRLMLPHVSPGEYWVRARHPGTALMPWTKVEVAEADLKLSPELAVGSTLVVPFPAGFTAERTYEKSPVELWRNGSLFGSSGPAPAAAATHFTESFIFGNLPPGEYEARFSIKDRHLMAKALIHGDSPVYFLSELSEAARDSRPEDGAHE